MKGYFYILSLAVAAIMPAKMSAQSETQRTNIPPLLKSQWGQDAPFYYATPEIGGQHCRTGCGAAALSQVLYYHQYPLKPAPGVYSYQTGRLGNVSFDFGEVEFDYGVMKDVYRREDSENDPSVMAVAQLQFAAGVTLNMDYALEESSASFGMVPGSLSGRFLYPDNGMRLLSREYFTNQEWESIIYNELSCNRPVLYLGGNGSWSHIFVCDGYKDGKFHMNWGWYGEKEDYFSLTNLQTERVKDDGILVLNSGQKIVIGVRPEGQPLPEPVTFATTFDYHTDSDSFSVSGISSSYIATTITPGIMAIDSDGKEYILWCEEPAVMSKSAANINYSVLIGSLADGNYRLRPIYAIGEPSNHEAEVYSVYCNPRNTRYVDVEVANGRIVSSASGTDAEINVTISDFVTPHTLIKGETYNASFSVHAENIGNTTVDYFKLKFYAPGSDTAEAVNEQALSVLLTPGDSKTVVMSIPSALAPGEYDMFIVDGSGGTKPTYPILSAPIRIYWRDNSKAFRWDKYNLRVLALSEDTGEAILLKNKPGAPSVAQGLTGELVIPETIGSNSQTGVKTYNADELKIIEIGPQLAYNETGLTSVTIPASVKNIGSMAFAGCTGLTQVKSEAAIPPVLQNKAFDEATTSSAVLTVPAGTAEAYRAAEGWKNFAAIVEATTGDNLSMQSFSIAPGGSVTVPLSLTTSTEYYGCQFEMELPEGLELASDGAALSEAIDQNDFAFSYSATSDNSYIFILYSSKHNPLPTGGSPLVDFTFLAEEYFKGGTIEFTGIELSADGGEVDNAVDFNPVSCMVTLENISTAVSELEDSIVGPVDIYDITGVLIVRNAQLDGIGDSLTPGLYIIRCGNSTKKILVK